MTRASPSTSASTRARRQPTARKIPISRVRSKIDMSIVLSMPTEPRMSATAAVAQAMALASRIWVSLCTWSRAGVAATPEIVDSIRCRRSSMDFGSEEAARTRNPVTWPSLPIIC